MEDHLLSLLNATQLTDNTSRKDAETQIELLYSNEQFPSALVSIASHNLVPINNRQAALNVLRIFVQKSWSPQIPEFAGAVLVNDATKEQIRRALYSIIIDEDVDSKVTTAAAAVVSKIAKSDYPETWPDLLSNLLTQAPLASNAQLNGILTVLSELVLEGLNEAEFSENARKLFACLYNVAVTESRTFTLRAFAVLVFSSCFDTIEMAKQENKAAARQLTQDALDMWLPFFIEYLKLPMPAIPSKEEEDKSDPVALNWRGMVMLKVQIIKSLARIQKVFPQLLNARAWELFVIVWEGLQAHAGIYFALYIDTDERQGKLTDSHDLQYTFDFLVLEEIDYLQGLLGAPGVKRELSSQLPDDSKLGPDGPAQWVVQFLSKLIEFAHITAEDEGMWDADIMVWLEEETSTTSSYTQRSACSFFLRRLCAWIPEQTMAGQLACLKGIFDNEGSSWKAKEAAFFMLEQLINELFPDDQVIHPDVTATCLDYVRKSLTDSTDLLRSRSHSVASAIVRASDKSHMPIIVELGQYTLAAIRNDSSDVVKLACVRAMQAYLSTITGPTLLEIQKQTIGAISDVLDAQDLDELHASEGLSETLIETLRDAIVADPPASLEHNALTVLFTLLKYSSKDANTSFIAEEAFEYICGAIAEKGQEAYGDLCSKVLPTLMGALDVAEMTSNEELGATSIAMLAQLTESSPHGLPQGFVATVMPKLCRILHADDTMTLHQTATTIIQYMLASDHQQVFSWQDPQVGKGGLEMILLVIERLLGPQVDDRSAAEVGSLAVELVDKADPNTLRPLIPGILNVSVVRLHYARYDPLIQSLVLIFAHLAMHDAVNLLDFLETIKVDGPDGGSGLEVVMRKWLSSSVNFVGAKAIQKNIQGLANIYKLYDPRLLKMQTEGDLIVKQTSRIKTRSMAKKEPDQYEIITVQLKMFKVMVAEIPPDPSPFEPPPMQARRSSKLGALLSPTRDSDEDDEEDEEDWEDDDNEILDLANQAMREELMSPPTSHSHYNKEYDNETQKFLLGFFRSIAEHPGFGEMFERLTDGERQRLEALEQIGRAADHFRLGSVGSARGA